MPRVGFMGSADNENGSISALPVDCSAFLCNKEALSTFPFRNGRVLSSLVLSGTQKELNLFSERYDDRE